MVAGDAESVAGGEACRRCLVVGELVAGTAERGLEQAWVAPAGSVTDCFPLFREFTQRRAALLHDPAGRCHRTSLGRTTPAALPMAVSFNLSMGVCLYERNDNSSCRQADRRRRLNSSSAFESLLASCGVSTIISQLSACILHGRLSSADPVQVRRTPRNRARVGDQLDRISKQAVDHGGARQPSGSDPGQSEPAMYA
jgi:hypothetical protein